MLKWRRMKPLGSKPKKEHMVHPNLHLHLKMTKSSLKQRKLLKLMRTKIKQNLKRKKLIALQRELPKSFEN